MSVPSIAESLFATREDMTEEQKLKEAQKIQDSLMKGFPAIATAIAKAQADATKYGYTETILGRRRHHPNMQLPRYEFEPMDGYVNPDIDPLDPESLKNKEQIPKRIVDALTKEFNNLKWYGKVVKRTKELAEQKIKVINNSFKIEEASRQCFNCVDKETEILTLSGWKKYDQIREGERILSYSMDSNKVEEDVVTDIHIYNEPAEVVEFESANFSAVSTPEHRWVTQKADRPIKFKTTKEIEQSTSVSFPVIRVAESKIDGKYISSADLTIMGWTDIDKWSTLHCNDNDYQFTSEFVSQLSTKQSKTLMEAMLFKEDNNGELMHANELTFKTKETADAFQYLAFKAGSVASLSENKNKTYTVTLSTATKASICNKHAKRAIAKDGVWCVTTNNHTWVARRNGKVSITGNSVIQGEHKHRPYLSNSITQRCIA